MKPGVAPQSEAVRGPILVVDDRSVNRQLLRDMLELDGHEVIEAGTGQAALALAHERDPDAILLDVSMPGMDGFEVCRRLRAAPATSATPILLITALGEREHRLQGMAAGADDYIVKPIDRSEVSLRVRNAVRMRSMHRIVGRQLAELQRMEQLRGDLVSMVAHDLRSPLTGLRGFLELMQEQASAPRGPALSDMLSDAVQSVDQINSMIGDMLDVNRMEADALPLRRRIVDLRDVASRAIAALGPRPSYHPIPIQIDGDSIHASCDGALIQRVLVNLFANAIRFAPPGTAVEVGIARDGEGGIVRVRDHGPGIPAADQERVFEKFAQLATGPGRQGRGSGLGLTFCRMVVERHGGRIGVTSPPGGGSQFWLWLPAGAGPD